MIIYIPYMSGDTKSPPGPPQMNSPHLFTNESLPITIEITSQINRILTLHAADIALGRMIDNF